MTFDPKSMTKKQQSEEAGSAVATAPKPKAKKKKGGPGATFNEPFQNAASKLLNDRLKEKAALQVAGYELLDEICRRYEGKSMEHMKIPSLWASLLHSAFDVTGDLEIAMLCRKHRNLQVCRKRLGSFEAIAEAEAKAAQAIVDEQETVAAIEDLDAGPSPPGSEPALARQVVKLSQRLEELKAAKHVAVLEVERKRRQWKDISVGGKCPKCVKEAATAKRTELIEGWGQNERWHQLKGLLSSLPKTLAAFESNGYGSNWSALIPYLRVHAPHLVKPNGWSLANAGKAEKYVEDLREKLATEWPAEFEVLDAQREQLIHESLEPIRQWVETGELTEEMLMQA